MPGSASQPTDRAQVNRRRGSGRYLIRLLPIPIFLILAALGSFLWKVPERLAAQGLTVSGDTSNPRFGLCFVTSAEERSDDARYSRAISTGASWDRFPLYWQNIEKSPGQFDWSNADAAIAGDVAKGFRTLAILMGTPNQFATASYTGPGPQVGEKPQIMLAAGELRAQDLVATSANSAPAGLDNPVFADGTDTPAPGKAINPGNPWANFVYRTVQRYKPGGSLATQAGWPAGAGVSHWEIWNEPNMSFFWSGTVSQYYRLLKVAYLAAKQADPGCTVVLGGLANWPSPGPWLASLLSIMDTDPSGAAYGRYFDVLAQHGYSRSTEILGFLQTDRQLLAQHGLSKPLWVTELGVPVWNDYPGPTNDPKSPYRATTEEQAAYVIQSFAYSLYAGAQEVFHFQLHDDCGNGPGDAWGLFRNPPTAVCSPSNTAARPAFRAYQVMAQRFRDATPLWRQTPNNDTEFIAFYSKGTGQRLIVMWATQGHAVDAHIPASAASATLLDIYGNATTLQPANGYYSLRLPAATNQNLPNSSEYMIGGLPYILVENAAPFALVDLVYNGSFESGLDGWQTGGSTPPVISDQCPNGKCLELGANFRPDPTLSDSPQAGNSTISQELTIEPALQHPTLRFYYRIQNAETDANNGWFEVIVIAENPDGSQTPNYLIKPREAWETTDWKLASFDLSPWVGMRVRLVFNVYQSSADGPTLAWVDRVSITEAGYNVVLPLIRRGYIPR